MNMAIGTYTVDTVQLLYICQVVMRVYASFFPNRKEEKTFVPHLRRYIHMYVFVVWLMYL